MSYSPKQTDPTKLKVLSLNSYFMGHVSFQKILERTFPATQPEIDFQSLHLIELTRHDLPGRIINWTLTRRLPGLSWRDNFYQRSRSEFALSLLARRCLDRTLKTTEPDVVHIHTQSIALLSKKLLQRYPSVVSIDYTTALLVKDDPTIGPAYDPAIWLERRCFEAASHIVSWSARTARSVVEDYGIDEAKVTHIDVGLPLELFNTIKRPRPTSSELPRLLFVGGGNFYLKGGTDTVEVFLTHFANQAELDVVTNAKIELPKHPHLHIHRDVQPFSTQLLELYQNADIFVMPSHVDAYGVVYIEAMAAGLPCIGAKVRAVPELVQDGYNGFTIKPADREELQEKLALLLADPALRLKMGLAGRSLAQRQFDAVKNVERLSQILSQVATNRKK